MNVKPEHLTKPEHLIKPNLTKPNLNKPEHVINSLNAVLSPGRTEVIQQFWSR